MAGREYLHWDDRRYHWDQIGLYWDLPIASYLTDPPDLTKKGIRHAMRLPDDQDELETLGINAADGAGQLEDTIPLATNRHDDVFVDAKAFSDARIAYDKTGKAVNLAYQAQTVARDNCRGFLMVAKEALWPSLGKKWTGVWAEAGWNEGNLIVPREADELLPIMNAQVAYLTAHPEVALPDARYNYTLVRATALRDALEAATNNADTSGGKILGVHPALSAQQAAETVRDLTEEALRRRLRGLHAELEQKIPADSPYWIIFGFDQPGAKNAPDPITVFSVDVLGGGRLMPRWENSARSEYTQIWMKTEADPVFVRIARVDGGTEKLIEGQTPGDKLTFKVRAANETNYGHFSDEVEVTVT